MTTDSPRAQPLSTDSHNSGLTIGELSRRTGVNVPTLRMWESRHGFPTARRLPSGHRRYDETTVDRVLQVQRLREAGVRLETAIAHAAAVVPDTPVLSVFAELRRRHPELAPQRLRKRTLLALTWALEDECCARAQSPWLFGAFQQERFYRQAEARWRDLARTARTAWVVADFATARAAQPPRPAEVPLPETSAMHREWLLVCVADGYSVALTAWESPGQEGVPDGDRLFESVWTLEPAAVADAARACARVVGDLGHDASAVLEDLDRPAAPASGDLKDATTLFNRVVTYVDRVR